MIGIDIVKISRIKSVYDRFGDRFTSKILSTKELFTSVRDLAKSFSVKESLSKALGTGITYPVVWHNIYLFSEDNGRPYIKLSNELYNFVLDRFKKSFTIHVSISHEDDFLVSTVMILLE